MQITFSPALGETVPLVMRPSEPDASLDVVFKAIFDSSASYEHTQSHGTRVEMWTDLPVEGRANGEWGAIPFTSQPLQCGAPGESHGVLHLPSPASESVVEERCIAYAKVALRLGSLAGNQRFSFTYRLIYASGDTRWLGAFGQNGTLIVDHAPLLPVAALGIELSEGWQRKKDGITTFEGGVAQKQEIGRLLNVSAWQAWAIGRDSWPVFSRASEVEPCAAVVLTTQSPETALQVVRNPPIVLSASVGASISIGPEGRIVYRSENDGVELALRIMDDARFVALSDCDVHIRLSGCNLNSAFARIIACNAPGAALPLSILVLPSEDDRVSQYVPLDVQALVPVIPDGASRIFAVTTTSKRETWVSLADEHVTVHIGALGGVAFVAPLYDLAISEAGSTCSWQVAVLQPHVNAKVTTVEEPVEQVPHRLLPTPPPSPPTTIRAAQRPPPLTLPSLMASFEEPAHVRSSALSTTVPTPIEEPAPPESTTAVHAPTPYAVTRRRAGADELAVMRVHSIYPLSSYIRTLLAMCTWIWRVVFRWFASLWLGVAGLVPESEPESDEPVGAAHSLERGAPDSRLLANTDEDEDTVPDGANTTQLQTSIAAGESVATPQAVAQPEYKAPLMSNKTVVSRSGLQVHIPGQSGKIDILVRTPGAAFSATDCLRFVLNGKVLPGPRCTTQYDYQIVHLDVPPADGMNMLTVVLV